MNKDIRDQIPELARRISDLARSGSNKLRADRAVENELCRLIDSQKEEWIKEFTKMKLPNVDQTVWARTPEAGYNKAIDDIIKQLESNHAES